MPAAQVDDAAGVERLRKAVAALKAAPGPLHPSPVFGPLTNDEWKELNLWHSEHHLGFLAPSTTADKNASGAAPASTSSAS